MTNKVVDQVELKRLIGLAMEDPFLGPAALKNHMENVVLIEHEGKPVGFAVPFVERFGIWRTGSIYIQPEYRGKGLAKRFITEFSRGKPVRAWIEPSNVSSIRAFTESGFRRTGQKAYAGNKPFDEYVTKEVSSINGSKVLNW